MAECRHRVRSKKSAIKKRNTEYQTKVETERHIGNLTYILSCNWKGQERKTLYIQYIFIPLV